MSRTSGDVIRHRWRPSPDVFPSRPACWSWPKPTAAKLNGMRRRLDNESARIGSGHVHDDKTVRWILMLEWADDRCAICGQQYTVTRFRRQSLVEDHDHETDLFRGFLCRSCNANEASGGGIFEMYRERTPAIIFNIKRPYSNLRMWRG